MKHQGLFLVLLIVATGIAASGCGVRDVPAAGDATGGDPAPGAGSDAGTGPDAGREAGLGPDLDDCGAASPVGAVPVVHFR